jgi:hypothetical protein
MTLTEELHAIAMAPDTARLGDLMDAMTALSGSLGWAAGWSRVKDDTAAKPVYEWLSECQIMRESIDPQEYLEHRQQIRDMAERALDLFSDSANPALVPHLVRIRRAVLR